MRSGNVVFEKKKDLQEFNNKFYINELSKLQFQIVFQRKPGCKIRMKISGFFGENFVLCIVLP